MAKKFNMTVFLIVIFLSIWGLIIFYPFYNAVLMSIVPQHVYTKTPFLLYPKEISLDSYKFVFAWKSLMGGLKVTTFVTVVGTIYNVMLTIFIAYALSKPLPGRKFFNYMIIFTMYFSGGLIPNYLLIKSLGLQNSLFSMILPTGINIMYMLIMRSYFDTLPAELEESAKIDGASELMIMFKIIIPLSLPMLATITLFYSVDRWNEWFNGMLYITTVSKMPLQLFIRNMLADISAVTSNIPVNIQTEVFASGIKMACIIVTMLPIACVYPFLQKYFVKGLVLGAVKG